MTAHAFDRLAAIGDRLRIARLLRIAENLRGDALVTPPTRNCQEAS